MHTHAFRLKALHSQKPPNTEPWNFTLDTYNCPTPTRSHSSALSSQRCHTISLLSSLLHRTVCTLPLLPLPKNHSEGLKHTFMELPSVHSIYGCMWNVQTILQHQEVNRAVFELTVLSWAGFFFAQKLSWSIIKAQNWRQVHICYMQPVLDLCLYITSTKISPHDNISASFREKWGNGASL